MGLFDRFRKVAAVTDTEALSADEESAEAQQALAAAQKQQVVAPSDEENSQHIPSTSNLDFESTGQEMTETEDQSSESYEDFEDAEQDDWDDLSEDISSQVDDDNDDWDDFDEEEEIALPVELTKAQRKLLERQKKADEKAAKASQKQIKKRGGVEQARPKGSRVDLSMMRTTTGRKLVSVKSAPKGSSKTATIETEIGSKVVVDLGGGVVEQGGRVIKAGDGLDTLLEELEWVLLESDISSDAVSAIIDALRNTLIGARLRKGADLSKVLEASLKRALQNLLAAGYWDFDATVQSYVDKGDLPVVIMMVGVNGTGKTTTAAKIAHRLQARGLSVIAAAGDTFRAGAIQQLESHCENLGIRCISSQRGGDAAAVVRDAINSAKAKNIDVVLVDTAGRMHNKTNLMKELNKVRRVANPHLTLFVGDALAGNDAVDQAKIFQEIMKFDGAVLTKMDTDAKGGAGLSIAFATGRPLVFAGIGQGYDDLLQFDPTWLLEQLFE